MEQQISISEIKKLLPPHANVTFAKKHGQRGAYLEIEVVIKPPISQDEHQKTVDAIIKSLGEDLLEVFTEEIGHWFYIYVKMSKTQPTTVTI